MQTNKTITLCDCCVLQVSPDREVMTHTSMNNDQERTEWHSFDSGRPAGGPERVRGGSRKALQDGAQAAE